jgi:segregation and condensation protein B
MGKPRLKEASEGNSVDDRSSDHDPEGEGATDAVARLRALHEKFAAEEGDGQEAASGADAATDTGDTDETEPAVAAQAADDATAARVPDADRRQALRIVEAILFAAHEPVAEDRLAQHLPDGTDVTALLAEIAAAYEGRGVTLQRVAGRWAFRTAEDLSYLLEKHAVEERRLSKAALETLAIIAYHQPVTRAEIEAIRGVATSKGTLDVLLETGWVRPRGRRRAPGKPITYGTTDDFLAHFGLDTVKDLPGLAELRGSGLLDGNLPPDFTVPEPSDVAALMPDELPLEAVDEDERQAELSLEAENDEPLEASDPADEGTEDGAEDGPTSGDPGKSDA